MVFTTRCSYLVDKSKSKGKTRIERLSARFSRNQNSTGNDEHDCEATGHNFGGFIFKIAP